METVMRQTWAFLFRGYHLTRRYISWVIVFDFYALVTSATVALIGVAAHDYQLILTLVVGALLWNFLSTLYNEIAMSIAYVGLGLMAAVLPVMSPERGAEATHIFQGSLLLVSGVYYPIEVLPRWLQPFS